MVIMERFLGKMDLAVFMALVAGCTKVGEIAAHSGYSDFRVREALKRLLADGFLERADYRTWRLAKDGHEVINSLWISYVELFVEHPEAHEMIASTIAEAHKMIALDSRHNDETHKMILSSAQNDRFNPPYMHVNDHACMDDADSSENRLADFGRNLKQDSLKEKLADSAESEWDEAEFSRSPAEFSTSPLEDELMEIGFDQPGRWLRKENVSWELVSDWLQFVNENGRIRNKAGFVRSQVEAGERPNLRRENNGRDLRNQVPVEYEDIIRR